jgi:hypothetical protein
MSGQHDSADGQADSQPDQLPTVRLPTGESVDLIDGSIIGEPGDDLLDRTFTADDQRRLDRLGLDLLDQLALALYVERYDDITALDALRITEKALGQEREQREQRLSTDGGSPTGGVLAIVCTHCGDHIRREDVEKPGLAHLDTTHEHIDRRGHDPRDGLSNGWPDASG